MSDWVGTENGFGRCVTNHRGTRHLTISRQWGIWHTVSRATPRHITAIYPQDMDSQCLLGGCKLWTLAGRLTHIIYGSIWPKLGLCVALLQSLRGEMSMLTSNLVFGSRIWFKIRVGELFLRWGEFDWACAKCSGVQTCYVPYVYYVTVLHFMIYEVMSWNKSALLSLVDFVFLDGKVGNDSCWPNLTLNVDFWIFIFDFSVF